VRDSQSYGFPKTCDSSCSSGFEVLGPLPTFKVPNAKDFRIEI